MKTLAFNTGRYYLPHGQIIAATVERNDKDVAIIRFHDISRMIHGLMECVISDRYLDDRFIRDYIMKRYDLGHYDPIDDWEKIPQLSEDEIDALAVEAKHF